MARKLNTISEGESPFNDVYASNDLRQGAPKHGFPMAETDPRHSYALVHDELMLDGVSRMNLATFCTTWAEPEVGQLMAESLDKNIVDKDEYPQTAELETRCVRMLADLWNSPNSASSIGTSTTGSSEAAMLGGLAAKFRWRAHRRTEGNSTDLPNMVCGPVQVCWEKFARYFDVDIRQLPLRGDQHMMTPEDAVAACDENTIMVVSTFGQTFTGLFENVRGLSEALDVLQQERGLDIPIHVDAASGGFLAPFTQPDLVWDFRIQRVKSINASGHKMGLAPLGCGWVLWREATDLPEDLIFNVNYLGGNLPTFNLNFSRPGGQIIAQYYNFIRLGQEGYRRVQSTCYEVAGYLATQIAELGPFEIIFDGDPARGITALSWRLAREQQFNLYDVADRLRARGWLVPAYPLPANRQDEVIQRILVRRGFSRDMADIFLGDLRRSLDWLIHNPPSTPLGRAQAGSFTHDATPAKQ